MASSQLQRYVAAAFRPAPALDTIVTLISPADSGPGGDFFGMFVAEEIPTLVPWLEDIARLALETFRRSAANGDSNETAIGLARQKIKLKIQQLQNETRSQTAIHLIIGTLQTTNLTLTGTGDVSAYLLHRFSHTDQLRYRWVNITETATEARKERRTKTRVALPTPTIITGTIPINDTLVICTSTVTDAMSFDWIEKLATQTPRERVADILEDQLPTTSRHSYGVVILSPVNDLPPVIKDVAPVALKVELQPKPTTSLWRPPEDPHPIKLTNTTTSPLRLTDIPIKKTSPLPLTAVSLPRSLPALAQRRLPTNQKSIAWRAGQLTGQLGRILAVLGRGLLFLPVTVPHFLFTKIRDQRQLHPHAGLLVIVSDMRERLMERMAQTLGHLPKKSRRLLVLAILLGYVFVQSVVFLAQRQTQQIAEAKQTTQLTTIQTTLDQAEAALTFGNDEEATLALATAETAMLNLPRVTRQDQARWQALSQTAQTIRRKLERRTIISETTLVATIPSLSNTTTPPDGLLLTADGNIVSYNSSDKSFVMLSTKQNNVQPVSPSGPKVAGRLIAGTLDDQGYLSFITDQNSLLTFSPATNSVTAGVLSAPPKKAADLDFYRNRLYILDQQSSQIWRYDRATTGFTSQTAWLTTPLPANATSLRIANGAIFVLANDGTINKFMNGRQQPWQAKTTRGSSYQFSNLLIPPSSKHLYAVDVANQLLTIFDLDTGRLLQTFEVTTMPNLKAMAVDEKNHIAFLLDGLTVRKFSLPK